MDERLTFVAHLPLQVERRILGLKKEYPNWGAPKIQDKLIRAHPMIKPPSISKIHAMLPTKLTGRHASLTSQDLRGLWPRFLLSLQCANDLRLRYRHQRTMNLSRP